MVVSNMSGRAKEACALGLVTILALIPLRGFLGQTDWPSHDIHAYQLRLAALALAIREGQWLGRWCSTLDGGYGYPLFTYYPPGFYLLSLLFYLPGLGLMPSIKCSLTLLQVLGAAGMYSFARLHYGRAGAAVSAAVWAFLPYQRANIFVRGAVAEFAALQLLPVVAWLLFLGARRGSSGIVLAGSAVLAGLICTHAITALAACPLLLLLAAASWRERRRIERYSIGGISLAIGLAAFYWVPALLGRGYVRTEEMVGGAKDYFSYSAHFLEWRQWFQVFFWGYGYSEPGPNDGMAFHLGLAPLSLCGAAWALAALLSRRRGPMPFPLLAGTVLAIPLLFLTTAASQPAWEHLPLIRYIQFPWRLLGEIGFLMAWAAGAALDLPFRRGMAPWGRVAIAMTVVLLVALAPPRQAGNPWQEPSSLSARPDRAEIGGKAWNFTGVDEFLPRDVKEKWPREHPSGLARSLMGGQPVPMTHIRGRWIVRVPPGFSGPLVMGQYWFPGWRLETEGGVIPTRPSNPHGLIEFDAPAGGTNLILRRERFGLQRAGDSISLLSLAAAAAWALVDRRRRRHESAKRGLFPPPESAATAEADYA